MLYLYQSNRLEDLAQMMLQVQRAEPLSHPLATEQIMVQSQGMRRYITQYWAQHTGIAANVHFRLPAALTWRLMRDALPDAPELSPFSSAVMTWRLLDLFQSPRFAEAHELQPARMMLDSYVQKGELSAYQLAGQLADVFDQYLVYRPDWIETWEANRRVAELDVRDAMQQDWQAAIWRELAQQAHGIPHRVQLWRVLMDALQQKNLRHLPTRLFVFGIATLAPMVLRLLQQIAQHRDVHIFALNPCALYWGDLLEPAQILQRSDDADLALQGHPLLASWGKQGRDFFHALSEAEAHQDEQHQRFTPQPVSGSLLHGLQYQIQQLIQPEEAHRDGWLAQHLAYLKTDVLPHDAWKAECFIADVQAAQSPEDYAIAQLNADGSLHIHSAHSPLRELQILHDQLCVLLQQNPDWQPSDIAVLTPDITPYAPFIEAVFGQHAEHPLPYTLTDVKLARRQPALDALAQILDVLSGRFAAHDLLTLLDSSPILAKWGIVRDDLPLLHDTVAQLNIRWGSDANERAQYGDADDLFTWQQGLDRLILGLMQPAHENTLWQGIAPHSSHPDHAHVLAQFAQWAHFLSRTKHEWQTPASVATWCERLRTLTHATLVAETDADTQALQRWEKAIARWQSEAETADFQREIGREIAVQHMTRCLHEATDAGLLRGGITFCSMVPMRSLPFKVVCLLGLNDGVFPRTTKAAPFDLIARYPQQGDRARRDDDRYLFLEAIMSAREVLYLSYLGRDIRNDSERAPSTLLGELLDVVAVLVDVPAPDLHTRWIKHHPLQAFSRRYFDHQDAGSLHLFSTRQTLADALNQPNTSQREFMDWHNDDMATDEIIEQKAFLRFWRNPIRHWLRHHLNWQAPYFASVHEDDEPFLGDQPRLLDDAYVHARQSGQDFAETVAYLRAQSLLPAGELGALLSRDYAVQAAQLDGTILRSEWLPARSVLLSLDAGIKLHVYLAHNRRVGQVLLSHDILHDGNTHGTLSSPDQVELLLRHLCYCAATADDELARETHYISVQQSITLPALSQQDAQAALSSWLAAYQQGQRVPLPYFARVNLAAAQAFFAPHSEKEAEQSHDERWQKAQKAASEKYHQGFYGMAQEDYPEVKLVFRRNNDAVPPYACPEFRALTERLFAPLANCLVALAGKNA